MNPEREGQPINEQAIKFHFDAWIEMIHQQGVDIHASERDYLLDTDEDYDTKDYVLEDIEQRVYSTYPPEMKKLFSLSSFSYFEPIDYISWERVYGSVIEREEDSDTIFATDEVVAIRISNSLDEEDLGTFSFETLKLLTENRDERWIYIRITPKDPYNPKLVGEKPYAGIVDEQFFDENDEVPDEMRTALLDMNEETEIMTESLDIYISNKGRAYEVSYWEILSSRLVQEAAQRSANINVKPTGETPEHSEHTHTTSNLQELTPKSLGRLSYILSRIKAGKTR